MPAIPAHILTLAILCILRSGYAQCPFAVSLTSTGHCPGDTLTVNTSYALAQIVWLSGGTVEKAVISGADSTFKPVQPGNYTVAVTNSDGCTVTLGPVTINPLNFINGLPLSISSPDTKTCSGMPARFMAIGGGDGSGNGNGDVFSYQWQVNGIDSGTNSPEFTSSSLSNGDIITCTSINAGSCAASLSNPVTVMVYPTPQIETGPPLSLQLGQSVTLQPVISGDVSSYSWSPVTGLSDSHIADPVAMPVQSTVYTVTVETADGCVSSGAITVDVFSPIRIPGAFTPNGDGKNDVFYIIGGLAGSHIEDFSIFDRWGRRVFQRTGVSPGDPAFGWNGYYNNDGPAAPTGTYVYQVVIRLADGTSQLFRGTVILAR